MIARATGVFTAKTLLKLLEMCIFTIIRTINVPTVNSTKCLLRVDISMSSLALFFSNKLGNIWQDQTIFFSTKSVSDQKIRDFHVSTEAHPGFGKGRSTTEGVGAKQAKGVGFHIKKTLILAHFFNEKGHAVSAVTRDNTKILSHLTVCLKEEAWPK